MINTDVLPEGWEIRKLGEVCDFEYGKGLIKENRDDSGAYNVYGSNGIVGKHSQYLIKEPCIIIGRKGAAGEVHLSLSPCWPIDTTYFVRKQEGTDLKFFYYQLKSLQLNSLDKSTAIPGLNRNDAYNKNFALPPLPIQQAIVAKIEQLFSELDKGVEQLRLAQQQLKVYRQAVLKWAFEGRLTNLGVVEGELPMGWKWVTLNEICKIIGGVTKGKDLKGKETIFLPYLRVANVQDGYLDLEEMKIIEVLPPDEEKYKLLYGDILYTEGGDKDKLGRGTIWRNEIERCIHQNHIFRARPVSKEIDSKYIAYFSQTKLAKNYFFKNGKQTTNLASINLKILSHLPLPLCPLPEQHQIVQQIESRLSVCDKIEETIAVSLRQAEVLRQSVLARAFAGKLV